MRPAQVKICQVTDLSQRMPVTNRCATATGTAALEC